MISFSATRVSTSSNKMHVSLLGRNCMPFPLGRLLGMPACLIVSCIINQTANLHACLSVLLAASVEGYLTDSLTIIQPACLHACLPACLAACLSCKSPVCMPSYLLSYLPTLSACLHACVRACLSAR